MRKLVGVQTRDAAARSAALHYFFTRMISQEGAP